MPKVTGIGGVFFKAKGDPKALAAWYQEHLGVAVQPWGSAIFRWSEDAGASKAATAWKIVGHDSDMFSPSEAGFMINYRVDDVKGMISHLEKAGVRVLKAPEASEYGEFASILDPDGNRIELWQPPA